MFRLERRSGALRMLPGAIYTGWYSGVDLRLIILNDESGCGADTMKDSSSQIVLAHQWWWCYTIMDVWNAVRPIITDGPDCISNMVESANASVSAFQTSFSFDSSKKRKNLAACTPYDGCSALRYFALCLRNNSEISSAFIAKNRNIHQSRAFIRKQKMNVGGENK